MCSHPNTSKESRPVSTDPVIQTLTNLLLVRVGSRHFKTGVQDRERPESQCLECPTFGNCLQRPWSKRWRCHVAGLAAHFVLSLTPEPVHQESEVAHRDGCLAPLKAVCRVCDAPVAPGTLWEAVVPCFASPSDQGIKPTEGPFEPVRTPIGELKGLDTGELTVVLATSTSHASARR